jgi:cellulase (glycosyl hydrolase family 5)
MKNLSKSACLNIGMLLLAGVSASAQSGNRILFKDKPIFLNGVNVPWNAFGTDAGKHPTWGVLYNPDFFDSLFAAVAKAGGNSVRWWVHCDGRSTPEFDAQGMVTGLDSEFIPHFDAILSAAERHGILVMPCLWSFDMAKDFTASAGPYAGMHIKLITDSAYTRAYIDKVLSPLALRYANHPALVAWEICNEPEWMLDKDGSTLQRATAAQLQAWTGKLAAAIHRAAPKALVTTGSASLKWNWNNPAGTERNLWSDSALIAAAGDSSARLDFYQVHYYSWMRGSGWTYSPFDKKASAWNLDKPVVIGEFPGISESGYRTEAQFYQNAVDSSYAGAMAWSYAGVDQFGAWDGIAAGVQAAAQSLGVASIQPTPRIRSKRNGKSFRVDGKKSGPRWGGPGG